MIVRILVAASLSAWAASPIGHAADQEVRYVEAQAASLQDYLEFTGSVSTPLHSMLSPQVAGRVSTVEVDAGDPVSRGQTLLRLDDRLAKLGLAREQAALDEALTRLSEARRLRDEAERLSRDGNLPKSQYETRRAEAALAEAAVGRLRAQHAEQAEIVRRHTLTAPFDGWISNRAVAPGEWIAPGDDILQLVSSDQLRIDVQVPQSRYALLTPGLKGELRFEALGDRAFPGKVISRVPAADPASRSFLVLVGIDAPDDSIVPGMSARLRFKLPKRHEFVQVPSGAVTRYPDGIAVVWVVDGEQRAQRKPVSLERREPGGAIVYGLSAGQKVIVSAVGDLRDGQDVVARLQSSP